MKMGYSLIDLSYNGFYLNPSIGCRHALTGDFALNVTFNYELQKEFSYGGYSYIGFKVGFEF